MICSLLPFMVELWIERLRVTWISHSPPAEQILSLLPGPKPSLSSRLCKSKADKCELSGANLLEIFPLVIGFIFQLLEKVSCHYHPCLLPARPTEREVGSTGDKEGERMKLLMNYCFFSLSWLYFQVPPLCRASSEKHLISWLGPPWQW